MPALPQHVLLIRHAETAWNREGIGYGHTDIPLDRAGARTVWGLDLTHLEHVERIFTSPLTRAAETANIIAHRLGLPTPTPAPALIERAHGTGEGIPKTERPAHVEGRETDEQIRSRVTPFLTHLTHTTLCVTHAGVIRALTGRKPHHLETTPYET